jgi:hypothetical protein
MAQAISRKSWLGMCLESVALTQATAPQLYLPTKSVMKGVQRYEYFAEERGTRDVNNDRVPTTRDGDTAPKGAWYNDSSPLLLWSLLGQPTVSQPDAAHVATVFKHTIAIADIPPSLSLWKSYHNKNYKAAGGAVRKVQLKWSAKDKSLEADWDVFHLFPVNYVTAPTTPTFTTVKPFAGYLPTLTTSAGVSADIDEMTISIEQDVQGWFPSNGVPDYTRLDYGARKASIEFQARFDTDTLYNLFLTNTDDSLIVDFKGALIANSGGSGVPPNTNYFQELSLTFGTVGYDSMEHDLGKDNVMIKCKATVRPTAGSLLSGFVQNTVAAYVPA